MHLNIVRTLNEGGVGPGLAFKKESDTNYTPLNFY